MTTIVSLIQETRILLLLILVILIIMVNQYLWHKRQMKIIDNIELIQPNVKRPSQMPQVIGIGIVLTVIGLGGVIEAFVVSGAGGSIILTFAGLGVVIVTIYLHSSAGEEGDNNCNDC